MKTLMNRVATVIAISAIAVGTASAMIPMSDLTSNVHTDVRTVSSGLLDVQLGKPSLPDLTLGTSIDSDNAVGSTGTQELHDLVGKHFI